MILIAFGHEKSVGKDTVARFLCSHLRIHKKGSNIQSRGFSDKVKDVAFQLYSWAGVQPGHYYDESEHYAEKEIVLPLIGKSPRKVWIELGTSVGRHIYDTTWVDWLYHNIKCDICIIKDLRFPNEANRILELGGYVYKIERPSIKHTSDVADDALIGYQNWNGVIINDTSLSDLNKKIETLGQNLLLQLK